MITPRSSEPVISFDSPSMADPAGREDPLRLPEHVAEPPFGQRDHLPIQRRWHARHQRSGPAAHGNRRDWHLHLSGLSNNIAVQPNGKLI